jgi:hypothetical protein
MTSAAGILLGPVIPALGQAADSPEALKRLMTDIYAATSAKDDGKSAALIRGLALPDHEAWFRRVFGDAAAAKLVVEYAAMLSRFEGDAGRAFGKVVADGQSDIQVLRFDRAGDPNAVGNQNDALAAMKSPQPLYSVRFLKPGERAGFHLYSFVHAGGAFRFVGRLAAAKG